MTHQPPTHVIDFASFGILVLSWIGWLSPIVAFVGSCMSVAWFSYQFYKTFFKKNEVKTVQE